MATFLQLKADVDEVAKRTVPAICYTLLEDELKSRLRLLPMEVTTTLTVAAESVSLPSDFLEPRHAYVDMNPRRPVEIKSEFTANSRKDISGIPDEAVVVDGALLFNAIPDGSYSVVLRYLGDLGSLSGDADTNDVMDAHYGVYLYGALKHFCAITRDDESMARWMGLFEQAISAAEKADKRKRWGGSPLRMQAKAVA